VFTPGTGTGRRSGVGASSDETPPRGRVEGTIDFRTGEVLS